MENQKRCTNFSITEEKHLLDLVHKFRDKIENKKTDTDANRLKKEAWKAIEKEFNIAGFETYRNALILKRKYENVKKRTKAKFADEKRYTLGTGGGPSKTTILTSTDEIIKEIIGDQLTGRISKYDSDTLEQDTEMESCVANLRAEINATIPLLEETEEVENRNDIRDSTAKSSGSTQQEDYTKQVNIFSREKGENNEHVDWSSYSADKLRTPKSAVLKRSTPKYGSLSKRLCNWAEHKSEMEDLRRTQVIEEQKLRLKHLQEIHELTVIQMKEKHQLFVEESRLKMKILEEEHLQRLKSYT